MKLSIFESYGKKELQQQQSEKHEVEHEHDEPKKPKFTISSALPFGWEKYSTHGMDYFQNHKRHLFSFQDPRENIKKRRVLVESSCREVVYDSIGYVHGIQENENQNEFFEEIDDVKTSEEKIQNNDQIQDETNQTDDDNDPNNAIQNEHQQKEKEDEDEDGSENENMSENELKREQNDGELNTHQYENQMSSNANYEIFEIERVPSIDFFMDPEGIFFSNQIMRNETPSFLSNLDSDFKPNHDNFILSNSPLSSSSSSSSISSRDMY